jgi:hypothetical protein
MLEVNIVFAILAALLVARASFISVLVVKYRNRGDSAPAVLHIGMLIVAAALAAYAAARPDSATYTVTACGLVLIVDLIIRHVGNDEKAEPT